MKTILKVGFALVALAFAPMAHADDVEDAIKEGMAAYKAGKFADAANQFDYAAQLARQKKGGQLIGYLPDAPSGWEAEEAQSSAAGSAMFGGGVTVERAYSKDDAHVEISILADSPMMQSMMAMISNPMFATQGGGKLKTIAGQRALIKMEGGDSGEVTVPVAGRYLVQIKGDGVSEAELLKFTEAVNYDGLTKLN